MTSISLIEKNGKELTVELAECKGLKYKDGDKTVELAHKRGAIVRVEYPTSREAKAAFKELERAAEKQRLPLEITREKEQSLEYDGEMSF